MSPLPLDNFTLNPEGTDRSRPDAAVSIAGTELVGFDHFVIKSFSTKTKVVGNFALYGPVEILEGKPGDTEAVVTAVGVQLEPDRLMYRWGWWLGIARGPLQQYNVETHLSFDGDPCKQWQGRIWAPFASLDRPMLLRARVEPGADLQIAVQVELPIVTACLNIWVRLIGYYQTKKR